MNEIVVSLSVKGQELSSAEPFLAEYAVNTIRTCFTFDEHWEGGVKAAVFSTETGEDYKQMLDENDSCIVPAEVMIAPGFFVSVFADWESDVETRLTTNKVFLYLQRSGNTQGTSPPIHSDDTIKELIALATQALAVAQSVEKRANSGEFNGHAPIKGVDYFTPTDKAEIVQAVIDDLISHTNLLQQAIDTNGSIYNGVGYKANTSWNASTLSEIATSGVCLSGYIPIAAGDVVFLEGVDFKYGGTNNAVHFFGANFEYIGTYGTNQLESNSDAMWDEDLQRFNIGASDAKYIRIQCAGLTEHSSVVTVNEPIV